MAKNSKVVRALCKASENGKEVVVLVELRARFDEENNIGWSKASGGIRLPCDLRTAENEGPL